VAARADPGTCCRVSAPWSGWSSARLSRAASASSALRPPPPRCRPSSRRGPKVCSLHRAGQCAARQRGSRSSRDASLVRPGGPVRERGERGALLAGAGVCAAALAGGRRAPHAGRRLLLHVRGHDLARAPSLTPPLPAHVCPAPLSRSPALWLSAATRVRLHTQAPVRSQPARISSGRPGRRPTQHPERTHASLSRSAGAPAGGSCCALWCRCT